MNHYPMYNRNYSYGYGHKGYKGHKGHGHHHGANKFPVLPFLAGLAISPLLFGPGWGYGPSYGWNYGSQYGPQFGPQFGPSFGPQFGPSFGPQFGYNPFYGSGSGYNYF